MTGHNGNEDAYGMLWSTVAKVQSLLRTGRPASRLEGVKNQLVEWLMTRLTVPQKPGD